MTPQAKRDNDSRKYIYIILDFIQKELRKRHLEIKF
jgi:hypothetical protein